MTATVTVIQLYITNAVEEVLVNNPRITEKTQMHIVFQTGMKPKVLTSECVNTVLTV
jgi:uncharacterized protein YneF (UPF0154 family)